MKFKDFWDLGSYINRVTILDYATDEPIFVGTGRKVKPSDFTEYNVESFTVERGMLYISVEKRSE